MGNLDTTRQPVSAPVDSGAPWTPDTQYTVENNQFRVTETIPADAVDIDGNEIVQGGLYCYPTVPHTSSATLTVEDLALMKRKGGGDGESLFSDDMTTEAARVHTLEHDVTFKRADNAQGNPTFSHTLDSAGAVETGAYDYAADGNTVVSSALHEINGGGHGWRFTGEAKLNVNGENGLPGDVVVSNGGRGSDPVPGYSAQNLVKVEGGMVDFATAEPTQNLANSYTRYWNTTATAQYPVGLYALVTDFNTLSGFAWRQESVEGCVLSMGGELFLVEGGELKPIPEATSQLYRELSSWTINGTDTRIHKPELLGNVEVVAVEDTETGATRYIWKDTDLPLDGPRYVRLRVRLDPANTTSMMFRAARPSNPSEFIVDLATGETSIDQSGTAPVPVVVSRHITADFAEYLVRFPQLTDATLWQLYPAIGPNGITNRNDYDPASVGRVDLELLDTNASPEATGNTCLLYTSPSPRDS